MPSIILFRPSHNAFRILRPAVLVSAKRNHSTEAALRDRLTSRPPNIIYDYLSPTPSHLLDLSLADFLPTIYSTTKHPESEPTLLQTRKFRAQLDQYTLPQGHHLVYFPPQIPNGGLLPDGTDLLHSPGLPFVRRMWAGGSLVFRNKPECELHLHGARAACVERISDVTVKGQSGAEKVFVRIERRIGLVKTEDEQASIEKIVSSEGAAQDPWPVTEVRNLVFMREQTSDAAKKNAELADKIIKPKHEADYSVSMIPTRNLLFRFSALTFNAHRIHLDPEYCRNVEGHRNLLVHGPLSLVLMLTVLKSILKDGRRIVTFDYRNLAPLYVDEELRICVKQDTLRKDDYEVWIEGSGGGYAVRGKATVDN